MKLRAIFDEGRRKELRDALKEGRPIEFRGKLLKPEEDFRAGFPYLSQKGYTEFMTQHGSFFFGDANLRTARIKAGMRSAAVAAPAEDGKPCDDGHSGKGENNGGAQ